jgi:poly-gamma-glutamate synthesis protein (capsule biosynthesis protein)
MAVRLLAGGDVFIGGRMRPLMEGGRLSEVLESLVPLLTGADIALANFEAAIGDKDLVGRGEERLVSPPETPRLLKAAGLHVAGLANNHALDLGVEGLRRTIEELESAGILTLGAGATDEQMVRALIRPLGLDLAILAYFGSHRRLGRGGANGAPLEVLVDEIQASRRHCSNVAVMLHWGRADQEHPTAGQVQFAHELIDSGAVAVLGSGPHGLLPIERYRHGVIAYSLGNLAFDMRSSRRRLSCVLDLELFEGAIEKVKVHPLLIDAEYRTRLLTGETEREKQQSVRSLVVNELSQVIPDSLAARRTLQRFGQNPRKWIARRFQRDRRANSLSDYARSLLAMIKESLWRH